MSKRQGAKHAGSCSSAIGRKPGRPCDAMWAGVLVGGARVAAGRCPALGPRLAARFPPQRAPESGLVLRRSLHATAARALPLIPIVVEQTVQRPRGDPARGAGADRGWGHGWPVSLTLTLTPIFLPRAAASAPMTSTRGCCGSASCASWVR